MKTDLLKTLKKILTTTKLQNKVFRTSLCSEIPVLCKTFNLNKQWRYAVGEHGKANAYSCEKNTLVNISTSYVSLFIA